MAAPRAELLELDTPFTRWLVRWRVLFFLLVAVLILLPFNGQWRMGLDSSLYRGLGDNLAAGKGYVFAGMPQKQAYFGLPFLIAALQKLLRTTSIVPVLVLMNVVTLAALWATYRLIGTRYPRWIAVVVTCGVGMNIKFVQLAQEVMTDMPFLLGCLLAMLGWEWLVEDSKHRRRAAWLLLPAGLVIAATMRPTFWVLALAWVITCVWNIVRHRERRSMIALGAILAVVVASAAVDPRVRGLNLLQGGYERELLAIFRNGMTHVSENIGPLLMKELPETFFNEQMWHFALPLSAVLLLGAVLVTRRQPLWGLQVLILTGVMLVLSDVPRYYVMVLPALWLGFVLALLTLLQRLPKPGIDVGLFVMFSAANFLNLAGVGALAYEQHHGDFAVTYRHGELRPWVQLAKVLQEKVPPDVNVIGPHGNLLAYLSGRNVLSGRLMGFDVARPPKYPQLVKNANPQFIVGSHHEYLEKDRAIGRMIEVGVIKPGKLVTDVITQDDAHRKRMVWLATLQPITIPDRPWWTLPTTRPVVQTDGPNRRGITPAQAERREIKAKRQRKQIRMEREERKIRNLRKLRRQQRLNAMQPSTTQPATTQSAAVGTDQWHNEWLATFTFPDAAADFAPAAAINSIAP